MYYNTTELVGRELRRVKKKAERQEDVIMRLFRDVRGCYGPSQVYDAVGAERRQWPMTSIRRAITNLTNDGKLEKMPKDVKIQGKYGAMEGMWRYKRTEEGL